MFVWSVQNVGENCLFLLQYFLKETGASLFVSVCLSVCLCLCLYLSLSLMKRALCQKTFFFAGFFQLKCFQNCRQKEVSGSIDLFPKSGPLFYFFFILTLATAIRRPNLTAQNICLVAVPALQKYFVHLLSFCVVGSQI